MRRITTAAVISALLALSGCANTIGGMTKDARQTGEAIGSSTHRVLKAGS